MSASMRDDVDLMFTLAKKRMVLGGVGQIRGHKVSHCKDKKEPKCDFAQLLEHGFSKEEFNHWV